MRTALAVAVVAVAFMVAAGCSAEKVRAAKEERLSAARLDGKFQQDDPLIMMLSPEQRTAMMKQGMLANAKEGSDLDGDGMADIDVDSAEDAKAAEEQSNMDAAGDIAMSVLSVSITLGMMAAPYLLF
jgi:hypothetical protein